jgi:hypothetical protein
MAWLLILHLVFPVMEARRREDLVVAAFAVAADSVLGRSFASLGSLFM